MSLTLYGFGPSRSLRCLWALEESGLDFDYVELKFQSGESGGSQHPDYVALNAQGKVPTLQHDDFVLTESAAIVNYIDELAGSRFIPQGAQARAKYDEFSYFVLSELEQPLWSTGKHRFALPKEQRIDAMFDTAKWEFNKAVKAFQNLYPLGEYALGDSFTFADCLLAHTVHWASRFKIDIPKPYLDYRDRMFERPAAARAFNRFS
jgi:glutathione S-transferase